MYAVCCFFFFNDAATTEIYTLPLHDALPIWRRATFQAGLTVGKDGLELHGPAGIEQAVGTRRIPERRLARSEEHTSELQSRQYLVCRLLLEKKKNKHNANVYPVYSLDSLPYI